MKIFCYNCGTKIEFSAANKPKFCMSCGASLDPSAKASTIQESQEDPEETQEGFSSNIDKLDFDFEPPKENKIKFGEALGSNSGGQVSEDSLGPTSISEEEFNKQWKKESGTLRSNSSQDVNE
tara:strand:+ start:2049 stop:2417 length:369 start_codon:yes stop_codon:yes gene_type:complete